jgi:hypothetical protein
MFMHLVLTVTLVPAAHGAILNCGTLSTFCFNGEECNGIPASCCGTAGGDTIVGTANSDVIWGASGDDWLLGNGGEDLICGANGDDFVSGGPDNDILFGGNGDDSVYGNFGADTMYGGADNDFMGGGAGADVIYGGENQDELCGGTGQDDLFGGESGDLLCGGDGVDDLAGGDGADLISGGDCNCDAPWCTIGADADGDLDVFDGMANSDTCYESDSDGEFGTYSSVCEVEYDSDNSSHYPPVLQDSLLCDSTNTGVYP